MKATVEVVVMEETQVRFTGSTSNTGGILAFGCKVEYSKNLDPFLPKDLKKQIELEGSKTTIMPFSDGRGSFTASSLEKAEAMEVEITAKLQTAH